MKSPILFLSLFLLIGISLQTLSTLNHPFEKKSNDPYENELRLHRFIQTTAVARFSKRRYTRDSRLCASAFVQEGKTFTDCTDTKNPDGKLDGKEWCYVDPNAGGSPNWGVCKPNLDYDKVRMKARELMLELIIEVRKLSDLVAAQINPASQTIALLESLMKKQNEIDTRLIVEGQKLASLVGNYQTLLILKKRWEDIELSINAVEAELASLKEIAENSQTKNVNNCQGMLGYEAEGTGDGVLAKYFDNEDFLGKTVDKVERKIDFLWEHESPADGVNDENFSVKLSTWLRIPTSGKYRFFTESDDGNSLYVNGQFLISHFMGASNAGENEGKKKVISSWLESNSGNMRKGVSGDNKDVNSEADKIVSESQAVELNGGMKYKLDFLMYHSVHNEFKEDGRSFAKLSWASEEIDKSIVSSEFFYTENKVPPVKISGMNPSLMEIAILRENENAFRDYEEFKLQDIPFQYQNKASLRVVAEYSEDYIRFSSTSPISLYIAVDAKKANPLPTEFEYQHESLSVLKILKTTKAVEGRVKATESEQYKVYKQKFPEGQIEIKLVKTKKNPTNRLVIFYSLDSQSGNPISCGGESIIISKPSGSAFQKCEVSSKFPGEGYSCESALSGKFLDHASGTWASNGQGMGAYMLIKFKESYQINKIQIKNRGNPGERNSKIQLSFGSGIDPQIYELKNIDEIQEFKLKKAVISNNIKITIKEVFGTINNGFSLNVWGTPCFDPNKAPGNEPADPKGNILKLTCADTFKSKEEFERLNVREGDSVIVHCEQTCALSSVPIYGEDIYSDDSSICKAAFHSGALLSANENVKMVVVRGEPYYSASVRGGVKSQGKGGSRMAIKFEVAKKTDELGSSGDRGQVDLKVGAKIDIFDNKLNIWLPGVVEVVERVSQKELTVTIRKEGYDQSFNEILKYPNKDKITLCGEMLKERACGVDSPHPVKEIKIAFGMAPLNLAGYILDEGKEISKKGDLEYGWSRDVSNLVRKRHRNSDPLNDNLILFPPDAESKWCTDPNPPVSCEGIDWSIKVKPGKYNVKVTVGDPIYKAQYDMKINEKQILANRILRINQFFTTNDDIIAMDGVIRLSAHCDSSCQLSWSRVSAIQITPLPDDSNSNAEASATPAAGAAPTETEKLDCGLAYKGGKCASGVDIENCIFESSSEVGISGCSGLLYMVKIPKSYECKAQTGKYKCIKTQYDSEAECKISCPLSNCNGGKCKQVIFKVTTITTDKEGGIVRKVSEHTDYSSLIQAGSNAVNNVIDSGIQTGNNIINNVQSGAQKGSAFASNLVDYGVQAGNNIINDVQSGVQKGSAFASNLVDSGVQAGNNVVNNLQQAGSNLINSGVQAGNNVVNNLQQAGSNLINSGVQAGNNVVNNLQQAGSNLINSGVKAGSKLFGKLRSKVQKGTNIASDLLNSGAQAVNNAANSVQFPNYRPHPLNI